MSNLLQTNIQGRNNRLTMLGIPLNPIAHGLPNTPAHSLLEDQPWRTGQDRIETLFNPNAGCIVFEIPNGPCGQITVGHDPTVGLNRYQGTPQGRFILQHGQFSDLSQGPKAHAFS